MKNIDFVQINKLSQLHNTRNIIFCKTDYVLQEFTEIIKQTNDVILITGNSDYPITDSLLKHVPKNIKKWYCQNAVSNNQIICPIPLGLENKKESYRSNHGIGYGQRVEEKENIINNIETNKIPKKLIYANYNENTNLQHRKQLNNIIDKVTHITSTPAKLNIKEFFNEILDHKMVLCPIGNGIDTHRLWETLYCNRVPVIFKMGEYKIYKLYEQLPIIILHSFDEILDKKYMLKQYEQIMLKQYNIKLLCSQYWISEIIKESYA